MIGCYLNSLPWKFIQTMASYPPQIGCFKIRQARTLPLDLLLLLIWPGLNKWAGKFGPGPGQVNDLAVASFTGLLFYLQEVILKDLALLMHRFPECAV